MPTDLPDVTPAEIEAAIDLLCSRGWSPPNAHGFATDIRDAIIAARRRAPPIAAPALSAMATGEDGLRWILDAAAEMGEHGGASGLAIACWIKDKLARGFATPPAAPAARLCFPLAPPGDPAHVAAPAAVTDLLRECRQHVTDHGSTADCWHAGGLGDRIDQAIAAASAAPEAKP